MKLKTEEVNGKVYALVLDGKPVYVHDDGKELGFDAPASVAAIAARNREAQTNRERYETAEAKLKNFDGIEDPALALKALETVSNLDQGQLVTAGKVEEIKREAKKAAEDQVANATKGLNEQIKALTGERDKVQSEFFNEKVGGAFARSKFISEKTILPPDVAQATFGSRFKIENGKIVGIGPDGKELYSRTNGGDLADFEEAIESMFDAHPNRDALLKGTGSSGSGKRPGEGGGGDGKTITRAQFDGLDPLARGAKMKEGYKVVD